MNKCHLYDNKVYFNEKFISNPFSYRNEMTLEGIKQFFIQIDKEEWKFETLCEIYNTLTITQSIIYCSNREKCNWLANQMIENQFTVVQMHENMSQQERDKIMAGFKQGNYKVLITSEIFGRSIEIELISLIINYDLPQLKELYIQRIGRTSKFGRKSISINFLVQEDLKMLNEIEQYYQTKIEEMPINFTDFL
ncbi:unnamed protein product [Paramecium primaurelia]|uniref:RNA helicase n=1 Tax=Paramecium primaurelia TaxID=5886 RepID=A0A8S1PIT4_PARPR|nr:unnamed protein product [Paramecium primaurelia]